MKHQISESTKFIGKFFTPLTNNGYQTHGEFSIERRWQDATIVAEIAIDLLIEKAIDWCDDDIKTPIIIHLEHLKKEIQKNANSNPTL